MDVAVQNANREGAVLVLFLFFFYSKEQGSRRKLPEPKKQNCQSQLAETASQSRLAAEPEPTKKSDQAAQATETSSSSKDNPGCRC
jgi:hypothetical protein